MRPPSELRERFELKEHIEYRHVKSRFTNINSLNPLVVLKPSLSTVRLTALEQGIFQEDPLLPTRFDTTHRRR